MKGISSGISKVDLNQQCLRYFYPAVSLLPLTVVLSTRNFIILSIQLNKGRRSLKVIHPTLCKFIHAEKVLPDPSLIHSLVNVQPKLLSRNEQSCTSSYLSTHIYRSRKSVHHLIDLHRTKDCKIIQ